MLLHPPYFRQIEGKERSVRLNKARCNVMQAVSRLQQSMIRECIASMIVQTKKKRKKRKKLSSRLLMLAQFRFIIHHIHDNARTVFVKTLNHRLCNATVFLLKPTETRKFDQKTLNFRTSSIFPKETCFQT